MSAFDQLDDSFPHGSVDGHRAGCRGRICPAPISCSDVFVRYCGDFGFRRQIDAGVTAAEIFESERAEREGVAARDRAAQRAEAQRRREAKEKREKRIGRPRDPRVAEKHAEVARLHELGLNDPQIAEALGMSRPWVGKVRQELGIPSVRTQGPRNGPQKPVEERTAEISKLHAEGLTDPEIADSLGLSRIYVANLRRSAKLRANRAKRQPAPTVTALPVVAVAAVDEELVHGTARGYDLGCRKRSACPSPFPCVDASLAAHRRLRREIA